MTDGITATGSEEGPRLTVAGILALAEQLQGARRKDSWRVSDQFAQGRVVVCHKTGESFYLVHPATFPALAAAYYEAQTEEERRNPLLGLNAIDLDPNETDDEPRAAWRATERRRVLGALADSITQATRKD